MGGCTTCKGTGTATGTVADPMLGPCPDCTPGFPAHILDAAFGPDAKPTPRWLAGLIAKHGEPVTLGAYCRQTWAWVGCGVQVEQTLTTWTVSAHRRGRLTKLAGLERYPTDAEISAVVALAGLDDAPERGTS